MLIHDEAPSLGLGRRVRTAARDVFGTPAFGGLLACCLVLGLTSSLVIPFLSLWGTLSVGMTPLLFACFMTLNSLCAMGASTLLARYSDTRWSRRSVLLLGGSGGALGYLSFGLLADRLGHRGITGPCAALGTLSLVVLLVTRRRATGPAPSLVVDG